MGDAVGSLKSSTLAATTGTAVVAQVAAVSAKKDDDNAYQAASKEPIGGGGGNVHFLAVLAPTEEKAMQYLANRPPGAHVLVKDESENLALYIKFKRAVRALVLVKAKELKKQEAPIEWGRPYRPPDGQRAQTLQSTMMTPVHRIHLTGESYLQLEQCWKRFLPQVKAILLQMCCETSLNEDAKLDDWAAVIANSHAPYVLTLTPHSCGFYILGTNAGATANGSNAIASGGATSTSGGGNGSSAVSVRHVEFDFQKHVMVVADGTFNPSAFIISTHFSSKKLFEADITYAFG
ncbi:hypothetical protein PybrP1_011917 [[Pythium] brassicae (nom. inval.)]|nr:hypothetical protein PybrP1_011917 [[Pythium] brassicae (nom. inval.)]